MKKTFTLILVLTMLMSLFTINIVAEEIFDGTICSTYSNEFKSTVYNGTTSIIKDITYTTSPVAPSENESTVLITTFDAINTVKGMPLSVHLSGNAKTYGFEILSADEILNKWYTYKVVATENSSSLSIQKIFRKESGSTAPYEEYNTVFQSNVPKDEYSKQDVAGWWNGYDITSAKFYVAGNLTSKTNIIRFQWNHRRESLCESGLDLSKSEWKIKNVQVISNPTTSTTFTNAAETANTIELSSDEGKNITYTNVLVAKDSILATEASIATDYGFIFSKDGERGLDYISFSNDAIAGDGTFEFGIVMYSVDPTLNIAAEKYIKYTLD